MKRRGVGFFACILVFFAKALFAQEHFYIYDKEKRVLAAEELSRSLKNSYILWNSGKGSNDTDSERLAAEFVQSEKQITDLPPDSDNIQQAQFNLSFFDRVQKFLAQFQDQNLQYAPSQKIVPVWLGFFIRKMDNKFVVTGVDESFFSYLAAQTGNELFNQVRIGTEILKIGDLPPDRAIEPFLPYIGAPSSVLRNQLATEALTYRNFSFPDEKNLSIHFLNHMEGLPREFTLTLPWTFQNWQRRDQRILFESKGYLARGPFPTVNKNNESESNPIAWSFRAPYELKKENTYFASHDPFLPVLRTGYLRQGTSIGVIQIFSFDQEIVISGIKKIRNFTDIIKDFLTQAKQKPTPLILDLRFAGGQNMSVLGDVLRMLMPAREKLPSFAREYRNDVVDVLKAANEDRNLFTTPLFPADKSETNESEDLGYGEKTVVLISSECQSACEIAANALMIANRAWLIGQPTSGTNTGFSRDLGHSWTTDPNGIIKWRSPNSVSSCTPTPSLQLAAHSRENKPIEPDIYYEETVSSDLELPHHGWYLFGADVINDPTLWKEESLEINKQNKSNNAFNWILFYRSPSEIQRNFRPKK